MKPFVRPLRSSAISRRSATSLVRRTAASSSTLTAVLASLHTIVSTASRSSTASVDLVRLGSRHRDDFEWAQAGPQDAQPAGASQRRLLTTSCSATRRCWWLPWRCWPWRSWSWTCTRPAHGSSGRQWLGQACGFWFCTASRRSVCPVPGSPPPAGDANRLEQAQRCSSYWLRSARLPSLHLLRPRPRRLLRHRVQGRRTAHLPAPSAASGAPALPANIAALLQSAAGAPKPMQPPKPQSPQVLAAPLWSGQWTAVDAAAPLACSPEPPTSPILSALALHCNPIPLHLCQTSCSPLCVQQLHLVYSDCQRDESQSFPRMNFNVPRLCNDEISDGVGAVTRCELKRGASGKPRRIDGSSMFVCCQCSALSRLGDAETRDSDRARNDVGDAMCTKSISIKDNQVWQ